MAPKNLRSFINLVILAMFIAIVFCTAGAFAGKSGNHGENGQSFIPALFGFPTLGPARGNINFSP